MLTATNLLLAKNKNKKTMTHLDSILKCRDITLLTKVKDMVFPVVMYECEIWTIKKAEHQRIDTFKLRCWIRLLRVPWTARRSNQSILKEINLEYSLEGLTLKLKHQYFGHLIWRADSLEKTLMLESLKTGGKGDDRGRDGWMSSLTQWTWVSASLGDEEWGSKACCNPWGRKESDKTEQLNNNNKPTFVALKNNCVCAQLCSGFRGGSDDKYLPAIQETLVWSLGQEDLLEKEMATHSSILAWKIPWIEEPGGLQSMWLQRVGHDYATAFSLSFSCVQLFCNPMDCCPPGSSVYGIFQARILEWVPMSFFRGLPNPGMEHESPISFALQAGSWPIYFNLKKRLWNFEWYPPSSKFQYVTAELSFFFTHHFLRLFKISLFIWDWLVFVKCLYRETEV